MLAPKMKKFLEKYFSNPNSKRLSVKHCVYMNRLQNRIDRELDMFLWLCVNRPDLFLAQREGQEPNERLKKLILALKNLNPQCDIQLVLERLPDPRERLSHDPIQRPRET